VHLKGRLPQLLLVAMLMVFPSFSFLHSEAKINPEDYDSVAFLHNLFALDYEDYDIANIQLEIDAALNYAHQASGFNGTVLVARNEKLVYSGSVGFAEFKDKELIDEHDAFQLASVSKQFTAAAILQLAEQKAISLDDSITHYIPELSYDQITIRQLLNHTSGLAIYFWLAEHKWEGDHAPSNEEMIALLAQYDMPQFFRSGRRFDYSNTGYILLASVVERVSGQSFGDYVEENIFKPLNMDDSFVYSFDHSPIRNNQLAIFSLI
jgi:CubicO group peptidase (beta-lactamase class C family)